MIMYIINEISKENLDLVEYNGFENKNLFTTLDWLEFVEEDSNVKPIFLRITNEKGDFQGYFTAMETKKFGFRIIGSPFPGWSTCFMGFDVVDGVNRYDLIPEVTRYLFKVKKAHIIEIEDRYLDIETAKEKKYTYSESGTLEVEIDKSDEELFKIFKSDARNFIRQFDRKGASLEFAEPSDEFAEEYYKQLEDVFSKQGMVPTYSLEKVKCILKHLKGTGKILCLMVKDPEGNPIGTSIYFGFKDKFFFWGGASYRSGQYYRPNEYMIWTAIKYWRERGVKIFDMVGIREYKRKFGSHEEYYAHLIIARNSFIIFLRNVAKKFYFIMLKIKGKFKGCK